MTTPVDPGRRPGRPSLLTDDTMKVLLDTVKIGAPVELCAAAAGIGEATFYRWMAEGRAEHEAIEAGADPREDKAALLELYLGVTANRVQAATRNVAAIQKAVQGGAVTEETTRTFRDHDGQTVTEKTVKRAAPDWRAASWYLERQFARHFGKAATEVQITGAGGGPIQVAAEAEDLSRRLSEHIAVATAGTALALPEAVGGDDGDDDDDGDGEIVEATLVDDGAEAAD